MGNREFASSKKKNESEFSRTLLGRKRERKNDSIKALQAHVKVGRLRGGGEKRC